MPQDPARRATKARWTWFTREMRTQLDEVLAANRAQLEAAIDQGIGFTAGLKPIQLPAAPEPPTNNDSDADGA